MRRKLLLLIPMLAAVIWSAAPHQSAQTSTQDTAIIVSDSNKLRLKRDDEPPYEVDVQYGTWHDEGDSTWFEPDVPVITIDSL